MIKKKILTLRKKQKNAHQYKNKKKSIKEMDKKNRIKNVHDI